MNLIYDDWSLNKFGAKWRQKGANLAKLGGICKKN